MENTYKKIHFVGIGGISMSGLAEILHTKGYLVSGSDRSESKITEHLKDVGIKIYTGHRKENIDNTIDLLVYTAAVKADNEELSEAAILGIPTMDRAELLGLLMKDYRHPISIAGTHGKTSTTSMLSEIFLLGGKEPTVSVGGFLGSIGGNLRIGKSDYFIVESCEYFDSFLKFYPHIAIILNVELDHVDYFKNYEQLLCSFKSFAANTHKDGAVVICGEIDELEKITQDLSCPVITYGFDNCVCCAKNISYNEQGQPSYDLYYEEKYLGTVSLSIYGRHNILNSLAAFCAAHISGIDTGVIFQALKNYQGVDRRFQIKGQFNHVTVVDDYAHHPTEVRATLKTAKSMNPHELWCVFQPHTYSRTKEFLEEFSHSFDDCDNLVLLDIYAAREPNTGEIHSKDLANKVAALDKKVFYFDSFDSAETFLVDNCFPNDMLITMGAGDVYLLGERILSQTLSTVSTK